MVLVAIGITYIAEPDGRVENIVHTSKPFFFVRGRYTERSRVNDMTKVIVQRFRKNVCVSRQESPIEFLDEFDLRGIITFQVDHFGEATEGGPWRIKSSDRRGRYALPHGLHCQELGWGVSNSVRLRSSGYPDMFSRGRLFDKRKLENAYRPS